MATPATAVAVTSFPSNPLTTPFARPSDCTGIYQSSFLAMVDLASTCLPRSFKTDSDAYFSPGIACPSGYLSACHDNTGVASLTTVTCCPTLNNAVTLSCVTTSTLTNVWSTLFCTWIAPESQATSLAVTLIEDGVTRTVRQGFRSPGGLNAFGVRMVHQRTDVDQSRASPTSSPSSTDTNSASDGTPSPGLSTGAKVAIGVAIPVVVLALLAGALVWWRRRRQLAPAGSGYRYEKTGQAHSELHGENVQEMMGNAVAPVELPATGRQK
ncbi:transmembrane alpha-helix domain-containing protein [Hirsutella rhossiliensis]|uniref:Transmembrane alpha-helix domain-containing protein n=1 Tax=Hirsutella rhossiliensis TaxID=111463 RepID=A0A9P8N0U2_9HYPO|nr:transmembrane alpha-helix domain-containing protein [Hirsutella rhossiliensis]KAH0966053.1 transmembrane alpha-helix domain-containing protein [Hirsutella rhossiliensis]